MSTTFANLLSISIGSEDFQLLDYGVRSEPLIDEKEGYRVGTRKVIHGVGEIIGTSESDFAAKIQAAANALDGASGSDVIVKGIGGSVTEIAILAARCRDGGPHVAFRMLPQSDSSVFRRKFDFEAIGIERVEGEDPGEPADTYRCAVEIDAIGLRAYTYSGEIFGPDALSFLEDVKIPALRISHPETSWVMTISEDANLYGDSVRYSIKFQELSEPKPAVGAGVWIGDISSTHDQDRDERGMITETWRWEVSITGDSAQLLPVLRAQVTGTIVRMRVQEGRWHGARVQYECVTLRGQDARVPELLEYEQGVEGEQEAGGRIEAVEYPGVMPILKFAPYPAYHATQRGRATAVGRFVKAPSMLWPEALAAAPRITRRWVNQYITETTWSYEYISDSANSFAMNGAALAAMKFPAIDPSTPGSIFES
jgi:hypothetical protein